MWLDVSAVSRHQLAGIVTFVVLVTLATLSGAMLWVSRNTSTLPRWGRTTILVLALVGVGTCLWTAYVGGRLRHSEIVLAQQPPAKPPSDPDTVFNVQSHIYHRDTCSAARRCTKNCIVVKLSEAKKRGGRPCEICGGPSAGATDLGQRLEDGAR
jgi:hypothetical protein